MITHKIYGVREAVIALAVLAALAFLGMGTAFAQTTSSFTPPAGYTQIGTSGVYYNSAAGMYYNPMTGQYTNLPPLGPATMNNGGSYIIPPGYTQYNGGQYYYNGTAGYYYDPSTGFYSPNAPINTGVTLSQAQNFQASSGTTGSTGTVGGATVMPDTTMPVTGSTGVITPGVPNTGAGGQTTGTLALLAVLAVVAAGGAIALSRRLV
jgi:hypothetical protein